MHRMHASSIQSAVHALLTCTQKSYANAMHSTAKCMHRLYLLLISSMHPECIQVHSICIAFLRLSQSACIRKCIETYATWMHLDALGEKVHASSLIITKRCTACTCIQSAFDMHSFSEAKSKVQSMHAVHSECYLQEKLCKCNALGCEMHASNSLVITRLDACISHPSASVLSRFQASSIQSACIPDCTLNATWKKSMQMQCMHLENASRKRN